MIHYGNIPPLLNIEENIMDNNDIKTVTIESVRLVKAGLFRVTWMTENGLRGNLTAPDFDGALVAGQRTLLIFQKVNGNRRIVKATPSLQDVA